MIDKCKCAHCGIDVKIDETFKQDSNLAMIIKYGETPINILINGNKGKEMYDLIKNIMNYYISLGIPECNILSTNSSFSLLKTNFKIYDSNYVNSFTSRAYTILNGILHKNHAFESQIPESDKRSVLIIDCNWSIELKDSIIINEILNKSKENNMYIIYVINDRQITISDSLKEIFDVTIVESSVFSISTKN